MSRKLPHRQHRDIHVLAVAAVRIPVAVEIRRASVWSPGSAPCSQCLVALGGGRMPPRKKHTAEMVVARQGKQEQLHLRGPVPGFRGRRSRSRGPGVSRGVLHCAR